jgi:deazaflavin-dependent oxidoreductase (nitroreductase family)
MPADLRTVRPSWLVRNIMRPLTKVLNPVSVKMAGGPGFRLAARIHHVGRRSRAEYVTAVGARVKDGKILIPLTFGNESDWVRNVRAAGGATVEVRRRSYEIGAPEFLNWSEAPRVVRANFPLARSVFKVLGIKQFMQAPVLDSLVQPSTGNRG